MTPEEKVRAVINRTGQCEGLNFALLILDAHMRQTTFGPALAAKVTESIHHRILEIEHEVHSLGKENSNGDRPYTS